MIFFYGVYLPISLFEWIVGSSGFPYTALIVGLALPWMRKNHIHTIKKQWGT
ncbi:hypothetical protein ACFQ2J_15445 [Thalassobacillus hwangdonensis]|uniref:Uncharacterized protein n=2 Tax=Thalassobacillus hwangdonensis TaxID=546108 RepID=A0ABW3L488_9BACI